jgi:CRISPR-associated protein Cas2
MFALFDLPVVTKEARKEYARFRKLLLDEGFDMLQYSVYARFYRSEESSETDRRRLKAALPPAGEVRLLTVTDKQFGRMEVFYGKKRKEPEESPRQLVLF